MTRQLFLLAFLVPRASAFFVNRKDTDGDGVLNRLNTVSSFSQSEQHQSVVIGNRGILKALHQHQPKRGSAAPAKASVEESGPGAKVSVSVGVHVDVQLQPGDSSHVWSGNGNEAKDVNPPGSDKHVEIQQTGPTTFVLDHTYAGHFATAAFPEVHITSGKAYYEMHILETEEDCPTIPQAQIGWAADGWPTSVGSQLLKIPEAGIGDDAQGLSFGFDPFRMGVVYGGFGPKPLGVMPWHKNGDPSRGAIPCAKKGSVVGVAIDLDGGRAFFGVNGSWAEGFSWQPGCVRNVLPAITGICVKAELVLRPDGGFPPPGGGFETFAEAAESVSTPARPFTCSLSFPDNVKRTYDESKPWPPMHS